eukprot:CAMPEP_0198200712 /NCGR_PEP_ID=MMETSP1445-20131203/3673_1 /TAXON_ID=36898 /ORGANISM="Pyramimonas sp., Strain CCMP2087" /LENGTH=63 /DNA_ID=CAMNT_0043870851 /DNA_START=613 /DNA_END=804 /DNA_ORIENTATION=-
MHRLELEPSVEPIHELRARDVRGGVKLGLQERLVLGRNPMVRAHRKVTDADLYVEDPRDRVCD